MQYFETIYPQSQTLNTEDFSAVREPALQWVIIGSAGLSVSFLLLDYWLNLSNLPTLFWALITLAFLTIYPLRRVPHVVRGVAVVILLQMIGITEILLSGPLSWEIILLTFAPLLATTLISLRIGAITLLSSFIAYGITLPIFPNVPEDKSIILEEYGLSLALVFGATMILGIFIFNRYNGSIRTALEEQAELETGLKNLNKIQDRRIRNRSRLIQTSTAINQRLSNILIEDMVVQALVEETLPTALFQDFLVYILPPNQEMISYVEPSGGFINGREGKFNDTHRLLLSYEPVEQVMSELTHVSINSQTLLSALAHESDLTPHTLIQAGSALVPIFLSNQKLGFFLAYKGDLGPFTNDDLFFIETLAAQTAISIRNARLFEKERHLARNEVIVQSLIEKIQKVDTIPEVLQMAAETLGTHLRSDVNIKLGLNEQSPFS